VESDCGDFAIQGTQLLVLNGVLDETGAPYCWELYGQR